MRVYIKLIMLAQLCYFSSAASPDNLANDCKFNYGDYSVVLKSYVDDKGMVNYKDLKADPAKLEAFVAAMDKLDPNSYSKWNKNDKIAFWLNAYNALTLKAIIDNYPIRSSFFRSTIYPKNSIRQIVGVWNEITFDVMGSDYTLEHIEHKILRKEFKKPGIHVALVCAAMACPPLRNEPYTGEKLDAQLDDQARKFLADPDKFHIDRDKRRLYLSPILKWFAGDFAAVYDDKEKMASRTKAESAVLSFVSEHVEKDDREYLLENKYKIKYLKYDWSLNQQQPKEKEKSRK